MERETFCKRITDSLSESRLSTYRAYGEKDNLDAIARYMWNAALCESLYPTLHAFEVLLRNAVHESLTGYYGVHWLDRDFIRDKERSMIVDALDSLSIHGKISENSPAEPQRIVAALPLGFWTGLFVRAYDRSVAIPVMNRGLARFPKTIRNREQLYNRFEDVRYLRNRIYHCEPIWHWSDLAKRHGDITDAIGYISPENRQIAALIDRFLIVYSQGWAVYKTKIEDEILA